MKLDAGGIARGYAADAVTDVLWHRGVQRCMVEAGRGGHLCRPAARQTRLAIPAAPPHAAAA